MSFFFISYKSEDVGFARELRDRLGDAEMLGWVAPDSISAGEDWKPAIDTALKNCVGVIVVVTPKSLKSQYVTYEWSFALAKEKSIIPIIHKRPSRGQLKMHPRLDDKQNRNFTNPNEAAWESLLQELKVLWNPESEAPELQNSEKDLYSHISTTRKNIIEFLLKHGDKNAVSRLFIKAIQSKSPEISGDSGIGLARLSDNQDERAVPGLGCAVGVDELSSTALDILVKMNTATAINELEDCLNRPTNQGRIPKIMMAIARVENPVVIPLLKRIVGQYPDEHIRVEIIVAIGRFKAVEAVVELITFLRRTRDESAKLETIKTLGLLGDERAVEPLYEALKRHIHRPTAMDEQICNAVLGAFRDISTVSVLDTLNAFRREDATGHYKYQTAIDNVMRQVIEQIRERTKPIQD